MSDAYDRGPWRLMRQDEHGRACLVDTFDEYEPTVRKMSLYESRGHKQVYWIEHADAHDHSA